MDKPWMSFCCKHYESGNMQSTQDFVKDKNTVWLSIISSAPGTQGYISPEKANELTISRNAFPSHVLFDPSGIVGRKYLSLIHISEPTRRS